MRVLITGGTGFVGSHLAALCLREGDEVSELSLEGPRADGCHCLRGDLRDPEVALDAVREVRPDYVYHLAAIASVAASWREPLKSISGNLTMTVNVLDAVRSYASEARVLVVSTGALYGRTDRLPLTEDSVIHPTNPYAASKAACDLLGGFYGDAYGLHVLRMRAFNHAGPGQSDEYVIASFARQIALAEAANAASVDLRVGDLRPRRDFTDVRDVVRAYRLAMHAAPPDVYNVCSGRAFAVSELLEGLAARATLPVDVRQDPSLLRPNDTPEIRGSHERLTAVSGWTPEIDFAVTLEDTLQWWRERC